MHFNLYDYVIVKFLRNQTMKTVYSYYNSYCDPLSFGKTASLLSEICEHFSSSFDVFFIDNKLNENILCIVWIFRSVLTQRRTYEYL
jgi:hypothetical protein